MENLFKKISQRKSQSVAGAREQWPETPAPQAVSRNQQQGPCQHCMGDTSPTTLGGEGAWHRRWPRCNPASEGRPAPSWNSDEGGPGDPISSLNLKNKRGGGKLIFWIRILLPYRSPPPPPPQ